MKILIFHADLILQSVDLLIFVFEELIVTILNIFLIFFRPFNVLLFLMNDEFEVFIDFFLFW